MATTSKNNFALGNPSNPDKQDKPIRAALFATLQEADDVVRKLLDANFTKEQITVMCSDEHKERHFKEFEHQKPAGTYEPYTALAGGVIGAVLGGLSIVTGIALAGGTALLATGALGAWGGGVFGGLIGAMMSRGVERELANFYDQEVQKGLILIAVDYQGPDQAQRLAEAERIFAHSNARPIPLVEG